MRYIITVLFFYMATLSSYAISVDSLLIDKLDKQLQAEDYVNACSTYVDVVDQLNEIYYDINLHKVEDLQKTYSIDELELENKMQSNRLLRSSIGFCALFIVLLAVCILYFNRLNKQIAHSEQELLDAKKMEEDSIRNKSLFLSNMSHEIRTPLNALSGFSELLAMPDLDNATRMQCNDLIQLNSELLLKLVNDVVDISCLDIANMKFQIRHYDAVEICDGVVKTISAIKRTSAEIQFETTLSTLIIETDKDRLQQLLINLLVNATKFTKEGFIVLRLERVIDKKEALFSVTDTGCGIPIENQAQIFSRFEKLNEQSTGFGLGLSICQLIVKRLGGTIWIDSAYTNGARFLFTHPLVQPIRNNR